MRFISYSDEEIHPTAQKRSKKSDLKHKHKQTSKSSEKDPKPNNQRSPIAGTPNVQGSKGPRARPTNAVSTPLPSTAGINPNASIDHLAELVRGLKDVDPVTQSDTQHQRKGTLDTSKLDMGMTVEVQNDLYVGGNLFDDTTAPLPSEQETLENIRQECLAKELDLAMEIESYKRRSEAWSEDLRSKLESRGRPGIALRNKDLRETCRRRSGPTDLRYSKLKEGRKEDLRNFIKPKRRTGSASPLKRIPREANSRVTREDIRKWVVSKLKSSITGVKDKKEEESETSDTSDSNEEGEVDPSEDELTNVRFSEPETLKRTPIPGYPEDGQTSDSSSGPKSQKRTRHSSRKDKLSRVPKPGPSEDKESIQMANKTKSESKRPKRNISPIKFPDKTPTKSEEEMPPLSRLSSRGMIPLPKTDLREELNLRPPSSKPKIDSGAGPIQNRISCDFPPGQNNVPNIPAFIPWLPGRTPINNQWLPATDNLMRWRTPHSNRPFITGNTTSRNDGTMTGQEEDENPEGSENKPQEPDENEN